MRINRSACSILLIAAYAASAQTTQTNANIRGGGGDSGKCTIEVDVDQTAEIDISGAQARMRTLGGSPAAFRRMDCTGPMPANPVNFNFSGVDGRGSQQLVRDPRQNRGTAVVRINDSQGGRENYTFDITWSGAAGYGGNGNPPNGFPNNGNGGNGGFGRDNNRGNGQWRYSDRNIASRTQAMQNCQSSAGAQIQRNNRGYNNVKFTNTDVDDNRWRADRITGMAQAERRGRSDRYEYSCSVDLDTGRVLDVHVDRGR